MAQRVGGYRRKSRNKLKKHFRQKGKISITKYLQQFKVGDRVALIPEPAVQKGMYSMRFYSKSGVVNGKKGRCYEIKIKDLNKEKTLLVHPIHLKRL